MMQEKVSWWGEEAGGQFGHLYSCLSDLQFIANACIEREREREMGGRAREREKKMRESRPLLPRRRGP